MTRLHYVKKARNTYRGTGVKKGYSYYWWKFAYGKKQFSLTKPRRSQLTRSVFLGSMMDLEDRYNEIGGSPVEYKSELEEIKGEVDGIKGGIEESLSNMEAAFPNGCPTIDQLLGRIAALEEISSQLEAAADSIEIDEEDGEWDASGVSNQVMWEYS